jgi:hypothetical protein
LRLEELERRQVPATFTVLNIGDVGPGTFRQALIDANNIAAHPGQNTIHFAVASSGVRIIAPVSALPIVTNPAGVIIDATTEGGFSGKPLVVLDGSGAGAINGLIITGGNSTIKGLAFENFSQGAGIELASSNNTIQGNFVGLDATGTLPASNYYGIYLPAGATHNTIGGTTVAAANVVSSNSVFGVLLEGTGCSNNLIQGNLVGTDVSGTLSPGNVEDGVAFTGASNNTLGGTTSGAGNQISGNGVFGVLLSGNGTSGNVLEGNNIGLNAARTAKAGNNYEGVAVLNGATGNTIGGVATGAGNVISGNYRFGVLLAANNTVVQGNLIGTDGSGTVALGNWVDGIGVGSANNTIGGTATGAGNVISGNGRFGIFLTGAGATGNVVTNNTVGAAKGGTTALGNAYDGVALVAGASGNTIGGTTVGAGNELSGNQRFGVFVNDSGTTGNVIAGNAIGLTGTGTALANTYDGIAVLNGASGNTIGGTVGGAMNVISSNKRFGVLLGVSGTTNNVIAGNHIGTDAAGKTAFANFLNGVAVVTGASSNTIGGTLSGAGNLISGNNSDGILVDACANTLIAGNFIGTDVNGSAALPNIGSGVFLTDGAISNTVGGTVAAARNLISGNTADGVVVIGAGTGSTSAAVTSASQAADPAPAPGANSTGNVIEGNYIGTDVAGTTHVANGNDGVDIMGGADGNTIGGTATGARNVISGNSVAGINLVGPTQAGNLVQGNYIGTDLTGTHTLANAINGVVLDGSGAGHQTIGGTTAAARNLISGNTADGIYCHTSMSNLIEGNYIGTDFAGTAALPNTAVGVDIVTGASNNTVGGTGTGAGNLISGNAADGVLLFGGTTSATKVTGTLIQGNLIGTDLTGTVALPNHIGVEMYAVSNNTVGGTMAQARNLISGNITTGLSLTGTATSNLVLHNFIGTDTTGTLALPNTGDGIALDTTSSSNTIGAVNQGNVISGNLGDGISFREGSNNNLINGNFIGTDKAGTAALGNGKDGVLIGDSAMNLIGSTDVNVISGNMLDGVWIVGSTAGGNVVEHSYIGVNALLKALPNHGNAGVDIASGASGNTVGGTIPDAGCLICGNTGDGVRIISAPGNFVQGNFIGILPGQQGTIANGNGIEINNAATNTIGGTTAYARNVISGNAADGVLITASANNVLLGNFIGTDPAGTAYDANQGNAGVAIVNGSQQNTIGGTGTGAGNVISGNKDGIDLAGTTTSGNLIEGNLIGTDKTGTANVGNFGPGIDMEGGTFANTVGGIVAADGNTIAFNNHWAANGMGVKIGTTAQDMAALGNTLLKNSIHDNGGSGGMGIDLGADGPTANGVNPRNGPNDCQNHPVLTAAVLGGSGASVAVSFTFSSVPNSRFSLEFFLNNAGDTPQGRIPLIFMQVATDNTGVLKNGPGQITIPAPSGVTFAAGQLLTATATLQGPGGQNAGTMGDTSEFSNSVAVTQGP